MTHDTLRHRIEELESKTAFQDRALQELSDLMTKQQNDIEVLRRTLEVVLDQLSGLAASPVIGREQEGPPPHY